jgi:hypothetical protein
MKSQCRLILLALALLVGSAMISRADQPHMRAAIEALQAAKTAELPVPHLELARRHLNQSSPDKRGSRLDAIEIVNDAIKLAKAGDLEKMRQKIGRAIAEVHSGMDKAR